MFKKNNLLKTQNTVRLIGKFNVFKEKKGIHKNDLFEKLFNLLRYFEKHNAFKKKIN